MLLTGFLASWVRGSSTEETTCGHEYLNALKELPDPRTAIHPGKGSLDCLQRGKLELTSRLIGMPELVDPRACSGPEDQLV